MAEYSWPAKDKATAIGKRVKRLDGMPKATGAAKYTYDVNLKNQLIAKGLGCPHAHCKIKSIDVAPAQKVAGVVHAEPLHKSGDEIGFQGDLLVVIAAESEGAAREGVAAVKIEYEVLPSFTNESDLAAAKAANRTSAGGGRVATEAMPKEGEDANAFGAKEIDRLFNESAHKVEASYGIDAITHCCLEPHGVTVMWEGNKLTAYLSTQNVSGTDEGFANDLKIAASDVEVKCDYIGGGFGGKFAPDYWSTAAARISKATGRPVKLMLDRDQELKIAGNRPSGYIKVRVGADKDGVITVWDSEHWGTTGVTPGGVNQQQIPYVLAPKNLRRTQINIATNNSQSRAWRAPNHPQACAITHTAIDDIAMKMGADSLEIFMKNLGTDDKPLVAGNPKPSLYKAEMELAAKLMDWKAKWHAHGKGTAKGSVVDGLGLAFHTWGGGAGQSSCKVRIHPTGDVETTCGTQDLGSGTRTVIALVLAECFGLPYESIRVNIGSSKMPASGASGGSTTVGGVSESHRRAGQDAFAKLAELAGKKLEVDPTTLEAVNGRVQVVGNPSKSLSWKETCTLLGMQPLEVDGNFARGTRSPLSNTQVGGVQMAHVEVDKETGVVRMKKFVAVQDMGLIISPEQAISQINGAIIMGIAYALFEQRINDPATGAFVNAELANYKLCRLGDVGEVHVELYEPEDQRSRGVIGLGEPPVIAPGAAISNAVANALGVRVPTIPLTPQRVLAALKAKA
jgi:xanthine dehydrogenase YagR molybdenum-binding subunit